jgi:hypothetical protein
MIGREEGERGGGKKGGKRRRGQRGERGVSEGHSRALETAHILTLALSVAGDAPWVFI